MNNSIYLVNPATDHPSYFNTEAMTKITGRGAANVIALALPTVAALVPDDFSVSMCDEAVTPVDLDTEARFVGITGMVSQLKRMKKLAADFRSRGKIVIIGGPHASLRPDVVRPYCDILVRGEIEDIATELFDDLRRGSWKNEYVGGRSDLQNSPVPRLDLYPNERTLTGAVQTSRGCPFKCEFCDVIQYHGNLQRFKPIATILAELDQLHKHGYRQVFITDDNLTANKKRARELLREIRDWNRSQAEKITFVTQLSIEAAADENLLELAAEAGIAHVFVGIETPNEEALKEAGKLHNCRHNVEALVERFTEFGISVMGGMIVGFDADGLDIFRRQLDFAMSLPIPFFTPVALFAHRTTPLYARLAKEGRVEKDRSDTAYLPWNTNVLPAQMSSEQLTEGLKWLCNNLYDPQKFEQRVRNLVKRMGSRRPAGAVEGRRSPASLRPVERDSLRLILRMPGLGFAEAKLMVRMVGLVLRQPSAFQTVLNCLLSYMQIRHLLDYGDFWAPELARQAQPAVYESQLLAKAS